MIDPRTLRGRLGLGYALALLAALSGFAMVALVLVDRTQRSALDEQLSVATRDLATIPDERDHHIVLDRGDLAQFRRLTATGLGAAIIDSRGTVLASTANAPPQSTASDLRSTSSLRTTAAAGAVLRVAKAPIVLGGERLGIALAWRDLDLIADLDRRLAIAFGVAIPLIAILAVTLGGLIVARGLRPLGALAALASEIEGHDLSARLVVPPGDDELSRLCATFDKMLDRLQDAFDRQRRFAGDASHELRAPLAVIRAEADLMLRKPRERDDYERALRSIAAHADELEALVRDLLAAARGEALAHSDAADLREVTESVLTRVAPLAQAREIVFTRRLNAVTARVDANALRRALQCVVHNALSFARRGGVVSVAVERDGTEARIVVADDGPGFSAEALAHAAERFWRDEHVRGLRDGDDRAGSGLGLSIAEAIAVSAGGALRLGNGSSGGGVVTIVLRVDAPVTAAKIK